MKGGQGGNQYKVQNHHNNETAKANQTRFILAKEYGVGATTIERDAKFAKGLDLLPPETKDQILTGQKAVLKEAIRRIPLPALIHEGAFQDQGESRWNVVYHQHG